MSKSVQFETPCCFSNESRWLFVGSSSVVVSFIKEYWPTKLQKSLVLLGFKITAYNLQVSLLRIVSKRAFHHVNE